MSLAVWKFGVSRKVVKRRYAKSLSSFEFVLRKRVIREPVGSLKLSDKLGAKERGKILGLKGVKKRTVK